MSSRRSAGHRNATPGIRFRRTACLWKGTALLISVGVLIWLVAENPFLVDNVWLGLLYFAVIPGAIGGILGMIVGGIVAAVASRDRSKRSRNRIRGLWLFDDLSEGRYSFCLISGALVIIAVLVAFGIQANVERGPSEPPLRLLIVGLDGMTWRVANPLLESGDLPTLAAAMSEGTGGTLESLKPMYSTRIFTSVASGKTADKHGIRGLSDTRSDQVLVKRVWDILEEQLDWDYGLVEWYLTWPPAASADGFCVPGILAMTDDTIPPDLSFIKKLRRQGKDVRARGGAYYLGIALDAARNGARLSTLTDLASIAVAQRRPGATQLELYHRQQKALVRIISDATCHRLRSARPEMLGMVYKATDSVSHKYWKFFDPEPFGELAAADVEAYGRVIEDVYMLADSELARIRRYVADDGVEVIMSDHGFQANTGFGMQMVSFRTKVLLEALGYSLTDVSYVNLGGSFYLQPLTLDAEENARMRDDLARTFGSLTIADGDSPGFYVRDVDKEGVGDDFVEVTVTPELQIAAPEDPMLLTGDGRSVRISEFLSVLDISGAHDVLGIGVFVGPQFRRGAVLTDASVLDITPTVLAALGLPVADDMDGRVLTGTFTEEFNARAEFETVETYETEVRVPRQSMAMDDMPEETQERLRSLGYMQ